MGEIYSSIRTLNQLSLDLELTLDVCRANAEGTRLRFQVFYIIYAISIKIVGSLLAMPSKSVDSSVEI